MGTLSIVATPIGNLEDITIRAIKTLFTVDAILCEDTRHTGLLLSELRKRYSQYAITKTPTLISYYDEIEEQKLPEIVELLESGKHLALVSDAGTPLISDPGFRVVRECIKRDIRVESVPGPSAALAALTSSGLPADKFVFLGYPPEKQGPRIKLFEQLMTMREPFAVTIICYCAPHKLIQTLLDMKQVFGDCELTIARELTKVHEEVWKGNIVSALEHFDNPKGELVILFRLA